MRGKEKSSRKNKGEAIRAAYTSGHMMPRVWQAATKVAAEGQGNIGRGESKTAQILSTVIQL